jgi:enoyl-CoA hydratase
MILADKGMAEVALETVRLRRVVDGVVLLTLDRPERGNGVVPEMARDLMAVLDELELDRSVRCLVITGAGAQFSAGADLVAMKEYLETRLSVEQEPYNSRVLSPVTQRLAASRFASVAAVNGGATAGGLDLALACDMRVASSTAKLGETYINLGLVPGNGGTWFLPRLVGSGMAAEMALTGQIVSAQRALEIGLVNRVVEPEDLLPTAIDLAARVASKPWRAIEATRQALRAGWQTDLTASMSSTFWAVSALHHTDDLLEGVNAFLEKRDPQFNRDVARVNVHATTANEGD